MALRTPPAWRGTGTEKAQGGPPSAGGQGRVPSWLGLRETYELEFNGFAEMCAEPCVVCTFLGKSFYCFYQISTVTRESWALGRAGPAGSSLGLSGHSYRGCLISEVCPPPGLALPSQGACAVTIWGAVGPMAVNCASGLGCGESDHLREMGGTLLPPANPRSRAFAGPYTPQAGRAQDRCQMGECEGGLGHWGG